MERSLSQRLASAGMALVVTFGLMGGIHSLAASEAAGAANAAHAAQMAQSAPTCARS